MYKNLKKIKSISSKNLAKTKSSSSDDYAQLEFIEPTNTLKKNLLIESDIESLNSEEEDKSSLDEVEIDYNEINNKYQRFLNAFEKLPTIEELIERERQRGKKIRRKRVIKVFEDGEEEEVIEEEMIEEEEEEEEETDNKIDVVTLKRDQIQVKESETELKEFDYEEEEFDEEDLYKERASKDEEESSYENEDDITYDEESSSSLQELIDLDEQIDWSREQLVTKNLQEPIIPDQIKDTGKEESHPSIKKSSVVSEISRKQQLEAILLNKIKKKLEPPQISPDIVNFLNGIITEVVDTTINQSEMDQLRLKLDKRKLFKSLSETISRKNKYLSDNNKLLTLCGDVYLNSKQISFFKAEDSIKELASKNRLYNNLMRLDSLLKEKEEMKEFINKFVYKNKETYLNYKQLYTNSVNTLNDLMLGLCFKKTIKREFIETQLNQMMKCRTEISNCVHRLVLKMDKYIILNEKLLQVKNTEIHLTKYQAIITEIRQLFEKIEERKEDFQKMSVRTHSKIHQLSHIKENINFSLHKYNYLYETYNLLLEKVHEKRVRNRNYYNQRMILMKDLNIVRRKCGLLENKRMLLEFDVVNKLTTKLQNTITKLLAKITKLQLQLSRYEKLLDTDIISNVVTTENQANKKAEQISENSKSANLRKSRVHFLEENITNVLKTFTFDALKEYSFLCPINFRSRKNSKIQYKSNILLTPYLNKVLTKTKNFQIDFKPRKKFSASPKISFKSTDLQSVNKTIVKSSINDQKVNNINYLQAKNSNKWLQRPTFLPL